MKIPIATIEEAVSTVHSILAGTGMVVRSEVQDEGEFLLITATILPENVDWANKELLSPYERQILQQLTALIPPKADGDYSWMVVFNVRDNVVDAVMDTEGLIENR